MTGAPGGGKAGSALNAGAHVALPARGPGA